MNAERRRLINSQDQMVTPFCKSNHWDVCRKKHGLWSLNAPQLLKKAYETQV